MIRIYLEFGYKNNTIAKKYGLGHFERMLRKAIQYHPEMEIVRKPEQADVIHLNDIFSEALFKRYEKYDKPIILHLHTLRFDNEVVYNMKNSSLVLFVSKLLKSKYSGIDSRVMYNAIVPYKRFKNPYRPFDFIVTSRNAPNKGLTKVNKKDKFIKISTGDIELPYFINYGYLPFKEYNFMMSLSKMHLLLSEFEPFGLATLYAMSQGCIPVISTNSGVSEIVPDELSIKVNPKDFSYDLAMTVYVSKDMVQIEDEVANLAREYDYRWYSGQIYEIYSEVSKK